MTPPLAPAISQAAPELVAEPILDQPKRPRARRIASRQRTEKGLPSVIVDASLLTAAAASTPEPLAPPARSLLIPPPPAGFATPTASPEIRDSLSALDLPRRNHTVPPPSDFDVDPELAPRSHPRRRWMLIGSSAASLGACLTYLALGGVSSDPVERQPVARPVPAESTAAPVHPDVSTSIEAPALPDAPADHAPPPRAAGDGEAPPPVRRTTADETSTQRERTERPRVRTSPVVAEAPTAPVHRDPSDAISVSLPIRSGPSPIRVVAEPYVRSSSPRVVGLGDAWATPTVVTIIESGPVRSNTRPTVHLERSTVVAPGALKTDQLDVRGSLATSIVRRAVARIQPQLIECYRQNLPAERRIPEPTTSVELTIDEVGRVKNPRVRGPLSPNLNECVLEASRKLVSGPPDTGTVKVSWRMRYGR